MSDLSKQILRAHKLHLPVHFRPVGHNLEIVVVGPYGLRRVMYNTMMSDENDTGAFNLAYTVERMIDDSIKFRSVG